MQDPSSGLVQRLAALALVAALVTFAVWCVWIVLALVLAGVGWGLRSLGDLAASASAGMAAVRGVVVWIALGAGAVLGVGIAFSVSPDRLKQRVRELFRRPTDAAGDDGPAVGSTPL